MLGVSCRSDTCVWLIFGDGCTQLAPHWRPEAGDGRAGEDLLPGLHRDPPYTTRLFLRAVISECILSLISRLFPDDGGGLDLYGGLQGVGDIYTDPQIITADGGRCCLRSIIILETVYSMVPQQNLFTLCYAIIREERAIVS